MDSILLIQELQENDELIGTEDNILIKLYDLAFWSHLFAFAAQALHLCLCLYTTVVTTTKLLLKWFI